MPSAHRTGGPRVVATAPPGLYLLPIRYRYQRATHWCWAACMQMAVHFRHAVRHSQCGLAARFVAPPGCACCDSRTQASGPDCNRPCAHTRIRGHYHGLGLTAVAGRPTPLPAAQLRDELLNGNPVQLMWRINGQATGHVALVIGFAADPADATALPLRWCVADPHRASGLRWMSYGELLRHDRNPSPGGVPESWHWAYTWHPL